MEFRRAARSFETQEDYFVTESPENTVEFALRLVHRVSFTHGAFEPGNPTLARALSSTATEPARAIAFVDAGVVRSRPELPEAVRAYGTATGAFRMIEPASVLTGGESAKNDRNTVETVLGAIHRAGICRRSYVLAIGGGALLDAVGFAAATAHRGVRLVRLPTTTLGQADSCVAVKNGINLHGKKNWLGSFAVPWAVVNDLSVLASLDERDWRSGFSEAVKVGLVRDNSLFERIERDAKAIARRDMDAAEPIIRASAEHHLRHITEGGDPFELNEARPLDFGHWAAHKLEHLSGYRVKHGEAVAIGVALDTLYSAGAGFLAERESERVLICLRNLGFALWDESLRPADRLLDGLEEFREHLGGRLTISMLRGVGRAFDVHEIDRGLMGRALERLAAFA